MEKIKNLVPARVAGCERALEQPSEAEVCSICRGAMFVHPVLESGRQDFSSVVPCSCQREYLRQEKLRLYAELCQLPEGMEHMSFESFKGRSPMLKEALVVALKLAEGDGDVKWLTLLSEVDRGKTHLAVAICRRWLSKGWAARYCYVPLMLDELRHGYESESRFSFDEQFQMFCRVGLLVLDDLGVERHTEWAVEKLNTIIDYRYVNRLPLVVTTNKPMDELPVRIASRLQRAEFARVVVIDDAKEYRLEKKGEDHGNRTC